MITYLSHHFDKHKHNMWRIDIIIQIYKLKMLLLLFVLITMIRILQFDNKEMR